MDGTLKYYMFDWDDNLLEMPTMIRIRRDGEIVEVTTADYAALSDADREACTIPDGEDGGSFKYFQDEEGASYFQNDLQKALAGRKYRPSFEPFKRALIDGSLFCIVTARGHASATFREGVRTIIEETFRPDERQRMIENINAWYERAGIDVPDDPLGAYLALNGYYGVTSPEFAENFKAELAHIGGASDARDPSARKTVAVDHFVAETLESTKRFDADSVKEARFGFSDDDQNNITAMQSHFGGGYAEKWERAYPSIEVTFFTYTSTTYPFVVKRFD